MFNSNLTNEMSNKLVLLLTKCPIVLLLMKCLIVLLLMKCKITLYYY